MRIVVAGTPEVAVPALNALAASPHEIIAVITRPDAASGRGRKVSRSPVALWADQHGVPVLQPNRPAEPAFLAELTALAPDCCPVIAYGALLPQAALDIPKHGWVNLHFSVLPAWRGAAPVQHAIMAGDEVTGAATFRLVAELDAGPVYATVTDPISATDTSGDLLERLAASGAELLVRTLDGIGAGTLTARDQPDAGVTFAPKITVEEARIDWAWPAELIDRRVRGCTPAPGAWTTFRGERLKLGPATLDADDDSAPLAPGLLQVTRRSVRVGTGSTALQLGRVQAQGKKPMAAADWARGLTFTEPEVLGANPAGVGEAPDGAEASLPTGV